MCWTDVVAMGLDGLLCGACFRVDRGLGVRSPEDISWRQIGAQAWTEERGLGCSGSLGARTCPQLLAGQLVLP